MTLQQIYQFTDYVAHIIGWVVVVIGISAGMAKLFFSLAHNARKKVDIDMDNYAKEPFRLDEFEVKLGDMFVDESGILDVPHGTVS